MDLNSDLSNIAVRTLCVTSYKAVHHICNLPPTCHIEIVNLRKFNNVFLFDNMCKLLFN